MAPPSDTDTTEPVQQCAPEQEIHCQNCNSITSGFSPMGFCLKCGAPLCPDCASHKLRIILRRGVVIPQRGYAWKHDRHSFEQTMPLLIVCNLTICKKCFDWKSKPKINTYAGLGSIPFVVFTFLALIYNNQPLALLFCPLALIFFIALISVVVYYISHTDDVYYRPTCPICGMNMEETFLQEMNDREHIDNFFNGDTSSMPKYILCPRCGYRGPISPIEGLWRYVAANGPDKLDGTPLGQFAKLAQRSQEIRKSKWSWSR